MTNPIFTQAAAQWATGLSVIPISADGTKMPPLSWKPYQTTPATLDQIKTWFDSTGYGLGVITGTVSGRLEMLEIEGRALDTLPLIEETATDTLGALWQRINTGWVEQSPSGGVHWFYRLENDGQPMPRNTKIARDSNKQVLAETRAEGGLVVTAPTPASHHPAGKPWQALAGTPRTVPTITMTERAQLHALFHALLDETPETVTVDPMWADTPHTRAEGDISPGDDFEAKTDWNDPLLLGGAGWKIVRTRGAYREWVRPGKNTTDGISATTGHAGDRDRLYVFSSSTHFDTEIPYTKLGAYAILHHGGDHQAAARDLAAKGYGHRAPRELAPVTPIKTPVTGERHLHAIDGTAALAPQPATITGDPDQLTDLGNARLTSTRYQHRLRYIPDAGRWAEWTGTRWEWAHDTAPATQAAIDTVEAIPTDNDQLTKHRTKSMSARAISNAVAILKTEPEVRLNAEHFDAHPHELNTPGGIVNLHTGELLPADPTKYHSMTTPNTPSAGAPKWEAFIAWTMQDSLGLARYLQQLVGMSLLGETLEPILPFLHGKGANGKSVFLETLREVLGDYAIQSPNDLLLTGPKQHPTELANLRGRRFVIIAEINEGARFDEAKLKQLTGGDAISARFMRQDLFTFTPTHTLWLAANHKPTVTAGGDSFWRRVRIIPFENQIPKPERNGNLKNELLEEAPGILQWAINGCIDYLTNGLIEPTEVSEATNEYASEEDHLGRFIEDRVQFVSKSARIDQTEFRTAYKQWCEANDEHELNATALGRALKTRFDIASVKSNGRRLYTGVLLVNTDDQKGLWND